MFIKTRLCRAGAAATAAVTLGSLIGAAALVPPAGATASVATSRISGVDRYSTAAQIAQAKYPAGVGSGEAIIASGTNFPDALAASCWAVVI